MDRRTFLATAAMGIAAATHPAGQTSLAQTNASSLPPIVLVHGGWHGGWCWKRVVPTLRSAGHEVFAPTLTGLGERVHLRSGVGLETHISDVVNVIEADDLSNVVLVGHSYAGMLITAVADRIGSKLRSLVYLDAYVPKNGQAVLDDEDVKKSFASLVDSNGNLPPQIELLEITDPSDVAWVKRRLTPQPFITLTEKVSLKGAPSNVRRTYASFAKSAKAPFGKIADALRSDPDWNVLPDQKTGHDCMITAPAAVARIVLEAV